MDRKARQEKIISLCIISVIFILAALLCRPVFYLNDDVTMRSILSGSYTGMPDGHAVYMKYPLTFVLAILYRLTDAVPWLELFFAGCLIYSVAESVSILKKEKKGMFWALLPGILFVLPFFWYMHYTIIAAVLAGTAAFLLCMGQKGLKPVLLWLTAWMVRSQVAYLAIPFLGVAFLWKLLDAERKQLRRYVLECGKTEGLVLAGLILCLGMNRLAYAGEDWQTYLAYNDARTELFDYTNFHSTDYYEENYEQFGMTQKEFLVLDSYNTMLDLEIDATRMHDIADSIKAGMAADRDETAWIKECVLRYYYQIRYGENLYVILWLAVFAALGLLLLFGRSWLGILLMGCLGGGRSLIWIYLISRDRFPERIITSLYVIELLLLAGMLWKLPAACRENLQRIREKLEEKRKSATLVCRVGGTVFLLAVMCLLTEQVKSEAPRVREQVSVQQEWNVLKEYCEKNEETLYLLDVFSAVEYGGFQYEKDCANLMLAGGWMSASPLARQRFERLNASDGGQALYENPQTAFLAEKGKDVDWLEEYLEKRFGECTLERIAEIICSEDKVFVEYRIMRQSAGN